MARTRWYPLTLALALAAAACGGTANAGTTYTDPDERSLFEIPDAWNLYDSAQLSGLESSLVLDLGGQLPILSSVGFDGAPGPNVTNLGTDLSDAQYPIGAHLIRTIGSNERDAMSRQLLEQVTFRYTEGTGAQEVVDEDFSFGDDFDGIRRLIGITDDTGNAEGVLYFVSVTDPADSLMYSMAAGCSFSCWEQYQDQIREVVDSWLVNTNQ